MTNLVVKINGTSLPVREYQHQRVVTFRDIDNCHSRPTGTARKRFNDNKKRFIYGMDYFVRNSSEAKKEFGVTAPNGLTLITESGYLMLVKSFTDDLAWTVQRDLVSKYFRVKEIEEKKTEQNAIPSTKLDPKFSNGSPVVTIRDLEQVTGINRRNLGYFIRHYLKRGQDYWLLEGITLQQYKRDNAGINPIIGSLTVVGLAGLKKLEKVLNVTLTLSDDKEKLLPQIPQVQTDKFDTPLGDVRKKAIAIDALAQMYERYESEVYLYPLRSAAWLLAADISVDMLRLGNVTKE